MRLKKDKSGDTVGRPSWESSLLGDPGAKFFCGKPQHMKNSLNFANTCLKVVDTRRNGTVVLERFVSHFVLKPTGDEALLFYDFNYGGSGYVTVYAAAVQHQLTWQYGLFVDASGKISVAFPPRPPALPQSGLTVQKHHHSRVHGQISALPLNQACFQKCINDSSICQAVTETVCTSTSKFCASSKNPIVMAICTIGVTLLCKLGIAPNICNLLCQNECTCVKQNSAGGWDFATPGR